MRIALCLSLLAGCNAAPNAIAGAAVMTPLALGAAAISRSSGGCYAVCQQGQQCNSNTGLCEALPCRGECPSSQTCEETFLGGIKCIDGTALSAQGAVPAKASVPAAPPPAAPPPAAPGAVAPKPTP